MNLPDVHHRALAATGTIVGNIHDDQLDAPTPCEEFDVRGLLQHLISGNLWVAPLVEEEAPADLVQSLSRAESRDDIAAAVLREAGRLLRRAALFIAQADRVIGWAAAPEPPDGLRSFSITFSEPSLFASLRNTDGFYVGPCPDLPGNHRILESLGATFPASVAAIPVSLKGKSVLFLLGEIRPGETPPKAMELKRLGALTAVALEILLLKNRLRSL